MINRIPWKYIRLALLLAFAFSFTIHFNLITDAIFDDISVHKGRNFFMDGRHHRIISFDFVIFQFFLTLFIAMVIYLWNYSFIKPFTLQSKISFNRAIVSIISSLSILALFILLAILVQNYFEPDLNHRRSNEEMISRNLFCTLGVILSILVIRFIHQKQSIELEVEQLRTQGLQSQLESLKNQMSPHFLFNSLTALKTLVEESPETANTYINHLSQVLRHSLQSHKKQLVTLKEELELTQSYVFLLKIRYGTNLSVETKIDQHFEYFEIPPLTIQNLVENAVKHNEISKGHLLKITIQTLADGNLQIKNNIQEKLTPEEGTGIGLSNLTKLYRLLGKYDVQIYYDDNEFRVEVPLIKPKNYESPDN